VPSRHCLVDHDDPRTGVGVALGEDAALEQLDPHGREVVGADRHELRERAPGAVDNHAFRPEIDVAVVPAERKYRGHGAGSDAWYAANAIEHRAIHSTHGVNVRITSFGYRQVNSERLADRESGIKPLQVK